MVVWLVCPGTTSCLPFSRGAQKAWMTSFDARVRYTGCLMGMWSSLAVVKRVLPPFLYSYCHHHWCPVTVTSTRFDAGGVLAKSKMSLTVGMATPARIRAGMRVQMTSALV